LIRRELGDQMEIAVEFHGYWDLPNALRIARALEEYQVLWLEDLIQVDNLEACRRLAAATTLPLAVSERLFTRHQFLPVLQHGIPGIINPDIEWCGGITEAKKIASLADAYQVPVAFHNYGGPILNFVSAHVAASIPNLMILETGRNLIQSWDERVITRPVRIEKGSLALPAGPGLGVNLADALLSRNDLIRGLVELHD
jgi:L-alanine-DL-glutamate epimerase-like enolase superfamily enzyme